ncbi:MAG: DUF1592 domain-containing protein [Pirellulaceae bacterium]|nr:DUF1592 domain-containing protein [Planctomycetales bacterium]
MTFRQQNLTLALLTAAATCLPAAVIADDSSANTDEAVYHAEVKPFLQKYCYDCHGDGAAEGQLAFDKLEQDESILNDTAVWVRVLKNLRTGVMPPVDAVRPSSGEMAKLAQWVKRDVFQIDPNHPDPGRSVLRRLNRIEYQNTIADLLDYDYDVLLNFPHDDTGYGFDNIGEVLTVSTMLTEKYLAAAEQIVAATVPLVNRQPAERIYAGSDFIDVIPTEQERSQDTKDDTIGEQIDARPRPLTGREIRFDEAADLRAEFVAEAAGQYEIDIELRVDGQFEYNSLRSGVKFFLDGEEVIDETFVYHDGESYFYHFDRQWQPGSYSLRCAVTPLPPLEDAPRSTDSAYIRLKIVRVRVAGPMEKERWVKPANFDRIYTKDSPPDDDAARLTYAHEVLQLFATRAFRRPVEESTMDALIRIAVSEYSKPEKTFEQGIAQAITAVLASPRFLYRVEGHHPPIDGERYPRVDDFALASRLSYFLWSTMPDDELFRLAQNGQLREQLDAQVERMVADPRSAALVENFAGQWLRSRDVPQVRIDAGAVIEADLPPPTAEEQAEIDRRSRGRFGRFRRRRGPQIDFDAELRWAMQQETEMHFAYILREDRSLLELLDCEYAFLNQRLAEHYKIDGVEGSQMRRVELPADSPRGGILTQGTLLTITSNPDRTSPVKRGLFILDNILGTPPPPPPGPVPELEESAGKFGDRTPALREVLELHRDNALCRSCHARMDPLGLALENFNALGMWRDTDRQQPIDPAGQLMSGETFETVRQLKAVLKDKKREDFYYCVTEKLLTYALGRGVEYSDAATVDNIVQRLEENGGRMSVLIGDVIGSPQFQRRRVPTER